MAEYIEKAELIKKLCFETAEWYCSPTIKTIKEFPAADVQPVKYGRWSECYTDSRLYSGICSVCGGAAIRSVKANPLGYCPNCGARMDGDTNE